MNTTNNSEDFHNFSKADWTKHWAWETLFKNAMICNAVKWADNIVEIGAANSIIDVILSSNFNSRPNYTKYDVVDYAGCIQHDISVGFLEETESVDAVIMAEVIEHIDQNKELYVLQEAYRVLRKGGRLVLTTPTPDDMDLVWPEAHDREFKSHEILSLTEKAGFTDIEYTYWFNKGTSSSDYTETHIPPGLCKAIEALTEACGNQIFIIGEKQ